MEPELTQNLFGLEISQQVLRLVHVKRRGKKLALGAYGEVPVPAGAIQNGEVAAADPLVGAIGKLLKSTRGDKVNTRNVVTVLPEQKTFIKVITVTPNATVSLVDRIRDEARNHIPLNLDEAYFDWQLLRQNGKTASVLIGVAPQSIVDAYVAVLDKAGLVVHALEIEAAAITRSLLRQQENRTTMVIDFGAIRTGLIIYSNGAVTFTTSLPISGNGITKTIAETLKIDLKKAEEAKILCGLDPAKCEGALRKVLNSAINALVIQIKRTMTFYQTSFAGQPAISGVVLGGGGANVLSIDAMLSEKLKLPVTVGAPSAHLTATSKVAIPPARLLSYTTAIGTALRPFQRSLP